MKDAKCLSYAPPLHRPDENIENYARPIPRERMFTLSDLMDAAGAKKAVFCDDMVWGKPRPAAFVINLSGAIIYRLLNSGIYLYEKPKP